MQVEKFKQNLIEKLSLCNSNTLDINNNPSYIVNNLYKNITECTRSALEKTCYELAKQKIQKLWWTSELKKLKKRIKMNTIHKSTNSISYKNRWKYLKKQFRKKQRKNIYLYEKSKCINIDNLLNSKNPKEFWNKIKSINNNNKENEKFTENEIHKLQENYRNYFFKDKHDSDQDADMIQTVENKFDEIKNKYNLHDNNINITNETAILSIINDMKKSNAQGFDALSTNMIKSVNNVIAPQIALLINSNFNMVFYQITSIHVYSFQ